MKEAGGGDNLAVSWQPPGGSQEVIPGQYLSVYTVTAPVLLNPGTQTDVEGEVISLQLSASDADGDAITFSATGLPPGLSIDTATGLIFGTLSAGSAAVTPFQQQ